MFCASRWRSGKTPAFAKVTCYPLSAALFCRRYPIVRPSGLCELAFFFIEVLVGLESHIDVENLLDFELNY